MDTKTLIDAYLSCRANKRRSPDSVWFELHWERDLVRLKEDFDARSLVPFIYAFVAPRPRPREVIACLMQGKVLQHYFDNHVRPLVEARLTDRTFNNRVGFGPDKAIRRLMDDIREVSQNGTRDAWIITRDIRAYFPSTDLDRSYEHYRALIEQSFPEGELRDDLLYILMRTNYTYPAENVHLRSARSKWDPIVAKGKSVIFNCPPGRGACLGNQYWQVEKNYDLNDFDHFQVDECGLHYVRFVDDMAWVVANKEAGLAHVALSERKLKDEYGYQMHPDKRYCQHYTKGGNFIGVWFKPGRTYVGNRVVRNCLAAIREWNRNPSPAKLDHFLSSINSYLGMMRHHAAYRIIKRMAAAVSKRWLRYCAFDEDRLIFRALPGYTHNELLQHRYHFKLHNHHGKTGTTQQLGIAAA